MNVEAKGNESTEVVTTEQAAELDKAADADFEAGYKAGDDDTPPAETRPEGEGAQTTATTEPTTGEAAPEKTKPAGEPEKGDGGDDTLVFEGLTASQLKTALANAAEVPDLRKEIGRVNDRLFGKIGEVIETVKKLQDGGMSARARKVTTENLAKTMAEYPEIAALLAEDLSGIVLQADAPAPVQSDAPLELTTREKATERKILTVAHRDWQAMRASDDFKLWKSTLPQEAVNVLNTTYDAETLIEAFDDFKAWRAKAAEARAASEAATGKAKNTRLAAAVSPKGAPAASEPQEDPDKALEDGFYGR